ncbi:HAD-superfamily phosphatase [Trametopsis cervina]|nr:HAD-superfamily phosphatase [Trametopsis cervina]
MPFNLPGTLVPLHLLVNPRLVLPSVVVKDIRQLDFYELRKAGYRGAVLDKDNCLTKPHNDQLVPELKEAWQECRDVFGEGNVLIVSNSAGTRADPGGIQAESVTYHLSVPVLRHRVFKPGYSCISSIRKYFTSLPRPIKDEELVVIGDRIFTDIVLANRMSRRRALAPPTSDTVEKEGTIPEASNRDSPGRVGPLSVWTTGVWQKESMVMRYLEKSLVRGVQRYIAVDNGLSHKDFTRFVKELPPPPPASEPPRGMLRRIWGALSRSR